MRALLNESAFLTSCQRKLTLLIQDHTVSNRHVEFLSLFLLCHIFSTLQNFGASFNPILLS